MPNYSAQEKYALTDEALLVLLKADHEWALKEIFDRYHLRMFRLAAGVLKDETVSKDIVQDIFIDLWKRRHTCDIRSLSHYLFRAVKFQVLKTIRDNNREVNDLLAVGRVSGTNPTEDQINFRETEEALHRAIAELPPRCREIFVLSRMKNLSHKEIALKLSISPKTIEVQIGKALAFLKERLK